MWSSEISETGHFIFHLAQWRNMTMPAQLLTLWTCYLVEGIKVRRYQQLYAKKVTHMTSVTSLYTLNTWNSLPLICFVSVFQHRSSGLCHFCLSFSLFLILGFQMGSRWKAFNLCAWGYPLKTALTVTMSIYLGSGNPWKTYNILHTESFTSFLQFVGLPSLFIFLKKSSSFWYI